MKKIHLLCNAHLDPVWLWVKEEGVAEAISTFRVAAKFCEDYDGFVFNHNEAVLYEWVEEHEPALFEKIKELVKCGKWRIMGGWYLQPDCVMPSGEGFIRQIELGNRYFMEKFGVKPTTAINFDPFGHTRGMVQIMKKCGYDSYVFMRPNGFVPENDFIWKGFDGSEIVGHCISGGYNTHKGEAVKRLEKAVEDARDGANLMLWGIGNHGGGASKVDLDMLSEYIESHPEIEIEHSYCEKYFAELDKSSLRCVDTSLVHCNVGCYTSMVRIKQSYRTLENELVTCEKMLAVSGVDYDKNQLAEAERALLFSQFHDILPGSMIKQAETDGLRLLNYGSELVSRLCTKAFFKLCAGQKQCRDGEIPVLVFNPHPYKITREVEVEFQMEDQNWTENEVTLVKVRTEDGRYIPCQNEKEASCLNLDWRKKICFKAELEPMSINRFDCELEVVKLPVRPIADCVESDTHFVFENDRMTVLISKKTGLIDKYCVDGIDRLSENSARIAVYADNEDPWGMNVDGFYDCIGVFEAVSDEEANRFNGYPQENYANVHVIENGDVRCKIQAVLKNRSSYAVVTYSVPKDGAYVDINIKTFTSDVNSMFKLVFNTPFENSEFWGQTAFGSESMIKEEKEVTFQKWCGLVSENSGVYVLNKGTYGGSAKDGQLNITVMRTPVYSAHPINDRNLCEQERFNDHIDMGEREFDYRLTVDAEAVDKDAEIFNQPVFTLSFFPSGAGEKRNTAVSLDNEKILLTAYRKNADGNIVARLFNTKASAENATLTIEGKEYAVSFGAYEAKAFVVSEVGIEECNLMGFSGTLF